MRSFCALLVLAFAAGCGGSDSGGKKGGQEQPPASGRIGPTGGRLASADGRLQLRIPAGALGEETEISIEALSTLPPHGIGTAYRLSPEGQTFLVPVDLSFTYAAGFENTAGLGVAFRSAGDDWRVVRARDVDTTTRTAFVSTTHFSEWALIEMLKLEPAEERVATGKTLELEVVYCFEPDGDAPALLLPLCLNAGVDPADLGDWEVNGVRGGSAATGTIAAAATRAIFTAPNQLPVANPVAISVDVRSGGRPAGKLVSNVEVIPGCPLGVCTLAGTTTYVSVVDDPDSQFVTTETASLRFDYDRTDPSGLTAYYRASGTVEVTWTETSCAIELTPSTFEVRGGELEVELSRSPPVFRGGGQTETVPGTQRWTCPGSEPFVIDDEAAQAGWSIGQSTLEDGVVAGREERENGGYLEWELNAAP